MDHATSSSLFETPGVGQLFIKDTSVEWWEEGTLVRRYVFSKPVILAGFKHWEDLGLTLCIILEDSVHFYYLKANDSFIVTLPFHISNAHFFKNGIILQRIMDPKTLDYKNRFDNYRFICISHPMSPFGSIQFSSQISISEMSTLELVYFPEKDTMGVALFYQKNSEQLIFYSVQLLTDDTALPPLKSPTLNLNMDSSNSVRKKSYGNLSLNVPGSSDSVSGGHVQQRWKTSDIPYGFNNSNNLSNNLRKRSAYNRRATSTNWPIEETNSNLTSNNVNNVNNVNSSNSSNSNINLNSGSSNSNNNGNFDIASSNSKLAQTPNRMTSSSLAKRNMSSNVERIIEMTPTINGTDKPNSADFSKDIYLTRITSVKIPTLSVQRKVVSTRLDNKQAIGLVDKPNNLGKIWVFSLNYSVMANVRFKAFGYSPISMTKTMDLKPGIVIDVSEYYSDELAGYFAFLQQDSIVLYNPYLELTSSSFQMNRKNFDRLYYISNEYMVIGNQDEWCILDTPPTYPKGNSIRSIFTGIKYVLDNNFHLFLSLWQEQRALLHDSSENDEDLDSDFGKDFLALQRTMFLNYDEHNNTFNHPLSNTDPSWVAKVTMCLHLMREEFQLNVYESQIVRKLSSLLTSLTSLMSWPKIWIDYYDCPDARLNSSSSIFDQPIDEPPSIFKTLYSARQQSHVPLTPFITLSRLVSDESSCDIDDLVTPFTNKMLKLFQFLTIDNNTSVLHLLGELKIDKNELESLPVGIYVPLKRLLLEIENEIDSVDDNVDVEITDRVDLQRIKDFISPTRKTPNHATKFRIQTLTQQSAEPKSILQVYRRIAEKSLNVNSELSKVENLNYDLVSTRKPIFNHKELFEDFVKALSYSKTHSVALPNLRMDYSSLLVLKKRTATTMVYRALTSGLGHAAAFLCSDPTLNQHGFIEEPLNLAFHFDVDDTTISLEKNSFPDDVLNWGAFHRGVARGLALDTNKKPLTSSWLNFNNQDILDPGYGGFLLGLGLNGHLSVLGEWQLYNFLSPKNTYVSIGLLLGVCISMRGSMSLKMTKVLSVHVLALLPPGSSNLNIDYRIQSTGLVSLGILYENTHNRRISELFSNELTSSININDENVPDEGYRLACGIGLGLTNMGCGDKSINSSSYAESDDFKSHDFELPTSSNMDTTDKETISSNSEDTFDFSFKTGTMDPKIIDKLINILVSVNDVGEDWMPVNSQLGAIVALMLIFLKTNCQSVADIVSVSELNKDIDSDIYIRPDLCIYREWCTNMIMWDSLPLDYKWILEILPEDFDPADLNSDILPVYYRIAGRCLSVGIKGASSGSISLREGLCKILDMLLPMYQYSLEKSVDKQLLFKGITTLINCILISLSLIMAGSGDLEVYKRIRYLHSVSHGRNSYLYSMSRKDSDATFEEIEEEVLNIGVSERPKNIDYDNHYGKFMVTNMSLGFLFLGLGHYALRTGNIKDLSYLIISVIPTFSAPYYLQETKYLWRLAMSERFLLVRDALTEEIINDVPILITSNDHKGNEFTHEMKSPCLLPVIEGITRIQVQSPMYYPLKLEFGPNKLNIDRFFEDGCCIFVKKRSLKHTTDIGEKNSNHEVRAMYYKTLLKEHTSKPLLAKKSKEPKEKSFYEEFCDKNVEDLELAYYDKPIQDFDLNLLSGLDSMDFELEIWRKRHDL